MPQPPLPPGRAGGAPLLFLFRRASVLVGLLAASLVSAGQAPPRAAPQTTPAAARRGRTSVDFAKGFTLTYAGNYKIINILSARGTLCPAASRPSAR